MKRIHVSLVERGSIWKYPAGTSCFYGCGKDDDKVRDCPTIAARGRESNKM